MRSTAGGKRAVALLAAACLAMTAAACGGGGGGKTLSKSDYLAQAKTVCQKGNRDLKSASDDVMAKVPPGSKLSDAQITDFVRNTVIPTIRDQVKQLRAIPPPKGEKAHVKAIYDELDKGLDALQKDPKKLSDGSNVFAAADALAQKYGISVCSTTG